MSPPASDVSRAGRRKYPVESDGQDRRRVAKCPKDATSLQNGGTASHTTKHSSDGEAL